MKSDSGIVVRCRGVNKRYGTGDAEVMALRGVDLDVRRGTINIPDSALPQVRGVMGVRNATPLALGAVDVRFANGRFQHFQVIGVDDTTLAGAPSI